MATETAASVLALNEINLINPTSRYMHQNSLKLKRETDFN